MWRDAIGFDLCRAVCIDYLANRQIGQATCREFDKNIMKNRIWRTGLPTSLPFGIPENPENQMRTCLSEQVYNYKKFFWLSLYRTHKHMDCQIFNNQLLKIRLQPKCIDTKVKMLWIEEPF